MANVNMGCDVDVVAVPRCGGGYVPEVAHGLENGIIELNWTWNEQGWVIWLI